MTESADSELADSMVKPKLYLVMADFSYYIMYIKEESARIPQNWPEFNSSSRKLLNGAKSAL